MKHPGWGHLTHFTPHPKILRPLVASSRMTNNNALYDRECVRVPTHNCHCEEGVQATDAAISLE
jgi:hypothetical protein